MKLILRPFAVNRPLRRSRSDLPREPSPRCYCYHADAEEKQRGGLGNSLHTDVAELILPSWRECPVIKSIVYYARTAGLANRLRALVGYQAMARCLGLPFFLCWVPGPSCDAEFGQLFLNCQGDLISTETLRRFMAQQDFVVYDQNFWFDKIWKNYAREAIGWEQFCGQVKVCLEQIRPTPVIAEKAAAFIQTFGLESSAGVHIRLTDNVKEYENWARRAPDFIPEHISEIGGFENFIKDRLMENPSGRVFLATDNKHVERKMAVLFSDRIVTYPKRFKGGVMLLLSRMTSRLAPRRTSTVEDALVEMLILSKCRMIAGTYFSSFSKFSSILGTSDYMEVRGTRYVESEFVSGIRRDLMLKPRASGH
jgi:hypothetical protein